LKQIASPLSYQPTLKPHLFRYFSVNAQFIHLEEPVRTSLSCVLQLIPIAFSL